MPRGATKKDAVDSRPPPGGGGGGAVSSSSPSSSPLLLAAAVAASLVLAAASGDRGVDAAATAAMALPRRPGSASRTSSSSSSSSRVRRPGNRGGGNSNGNDNGGARHRGRRRRTGRFLGPPHYRSFTSESVLPPLDVTELSAYVAAASSSSLAASSNGTDFGSGGDYSSSRNVRMSTDELFTTEPYVVPSAHQASDLGCSTYVCGPLPVVYTNHPKSVERWLCDNLHTSSSSSTSSSRSSSSSGGGGGINEPTIVGFDVESVPTAPWISQRASHDGPALVQISTPHAALVIQLTRRGLGRNFNRKSTACPALIPFLSDPTIIKAGVGLDDDMLELFRFNSQLKGTSRFDLGGVGSTEPGRRVGLARLVRSVLGVELRKSKKLAMSDWSQCPLDDRRVAYAARDAWAGAAAAHDLSERMPNVFGPGAVARLLGEERSIEELDDRARQRREAKKVAGEIYEQFREYGDVMNVRGRGTTTTMSTSLRQQMPESIVRELRRLRGVVDSTAPDGMLEFDAEEIGLIM